MDHKRDTWVRLMNQSPAGVRGGGGGLENGNYARITPDHILICFSFGSFFCSIYNRKFYLPHRMSISFNRRSSDAMTSSLQLQVPPLGPLPSRPSISLVLPPGMGAGSIPPALLQASVGMPRRRWRRGSVVDGGALGPARRMALTREISAETETDRRRNSRSTRPRRVNNFSVFQN